ncbi:MAG TPA: alpha/beta fold hydrolase [Ramlibacter sp.]|uniref:alpha/beta hydrolase n=1 Tax=Ramlibacter sp. TaxID=1917967 RepID=UPI002C2854E5|nr:alpha/beta fold hydrolase [Ramlibacter sp.]HVZ42198.1 alpha/beta fold hydrolase [Ramlibacter sp.]
MSGVRTESVTFFSGPGEKMAGTLYRPDPADDRHAGVVFCHGFSTVKEGVPPGLGAYLAADGYTMLAFDYRGFGGSGGARGLLSPQYQVEDTVHALEFLAQCPGVDPQRIGLYGTSFGGGVAAIAATLSDRPKALVISVPVVSGSRWLGSLTRHYEWMELIRRSKAAFARKVMSGDIELVDRFEIMLPSPQAAARYPDKVMISLETACHLMCHEPVLIAADIRVPTLMICVRDDTLTPYDQMEDFHARLSCKKALKTFEHGDHWAVYDTVLPDVAAATLAWFGTQLCASD